MINILITGGAGFIGSSLAEKLLQNDDYQLVIVDSLITGDIKKLPHKDHPRCKFIRLDVNHHYDLSIVMQTYRFEYVFHYAALVGVMRTLSKPLLVLEDINGFKNLLDLSKNTGVKRFFYASSSEVYGESIIFPQDEHSTPLNSRLPYAVVKNVGEAYVKSYKQEYDLDYTILRFFNTYGPKQSTDFVMRKFLQAAVFDEPITIYGDGSQMRTFCWIEDNVDATICCLEKNYFVNAVVNIGNDQELTILDLAKLIITVTNSASKIQFFPALEEGDMRRRLPNIDKMKTLLPHNLTTLQQGLQKLCDILKH